MSAAVISTQDKDYVYLDWAATTPLCDEARNAMLDMLAHDGEATGGWANANSLHTPGRAAFAALERARADVAAALGARPDGIVFTGGATEADNMAIIGIATAAARARAIAPGSAQPPHVVSTSIEHEAVLKALDVLEHAGFAVSLVDPQRNGIVDPTDVELAITPSTVLVSAMAANNEVGSIQPIGEIARIAHGAGALMHSDAAQALGKIALDYRSLDVDALSVSAHKVCGPKGAGALYLKPNTPFDAQAVGGGQEQGRRSGTQNVLGAVGFAAACKTLCAPDALERESARQRGLRDALYEQLCRFEGVRATVPCEPGSRDYLPNIASVLVSGFESETIVLRLDNAGFGVSGGSACSSHSLDPSHVLARMGVARDDALGSIRVSLGIGTSKDDIHRFVRAFADAVSST